MSDLPPEIGAQASTDSNDQHRDVYDALRRAKGNRTEAEAARLLGISRATLYRRLPGMNPASSE